MIFKKKKTVLEEQPLCYWEDSSYMMAVPKGGWNGFVGTAF